MCSAELQMADTSCMQPCTMHISLHAAPAPGSLDLLEWWEGVMWSGGSACPPPPAFL